MRTLTKILLALNGVCLLFIALWLLVGGGQRGFFGGGGAVEVDGVLLLFLGLFNVAFLATVLFLFPSASPEGTGEANRQPAGPAPLAVGAGGPPSEAIFQSTSIKGTLEREANQDRSGLRHALRSWALWALAVNGVLVLFVGLWLLINSDRWGYFRANATEVDMILLLFLSALNIAYMGLVYLMFAAPRRAASRVGA